jgi:hypothetical protein
LLFIVGPCCCSGSFSAYFVTLSGDAPVDPVSEESRGGLVGRAPKNSGHPPDNVDAPLAEPVDCGFDDDADDGLAIFVVAVASEAAEAE